MYILTPVLLFLFFPSLISGRDERVFSDDGAKSSKRKATAEKEVPRKRKSKSPCDCPVCDGIPYATWNKSVLNKMKADEKSRKSQRNQRGRGRSGRTQARTVLTPGRSVPTPGRSVPTPTRNVRRSPRIGRKVNPADPVVVRTTIKELNKLHRKKTMQILLKDRLQRTEAPCEISLLLGNPPTMTVRTASTGRLTLEAATTLNFKRGSVTPNNISLSGKIRI